MENNQNKGNNGVNRNTGNSRPVNHPSNPYGKPVPPSQNVRNSGNPNPARNTAQGSGQGAGRSYGSDEGSTSKKSFGVNGKKRLANESVYVETDDGEIYDEYTVGSVVAGVGLSIIYAFLYVVMVVGISVILACTGWILANDVLALNKTPVEAVITVSETDNFDAISLMLKEAGLIDYQFAFDLFAEVTGKKESISAGTYTLDTDMDYSALIRNLGASSETRAEITVTIPEGYTVDQIFAMLEDKGVSTVEKLVDKAANHDYAFGFLSEIPLGDHRRLEGYLFPDTYTFYSMHDPLYVINTMLVNFYNRVANNSSMVYGIEECGYTLHEVINMASMIERETDGTDREGIAAVIFNRLENPGYETNGCLQIDATLYYLLEREVTQNDRETVMNPYNTHINSGLPPGPISNPGLASINAVLNAERTNYYYYALGDDNLHHFYQSYQGLLDFLASQERYR
ncbi:MAG: endolytic transglycosylase MltG [Eubacteriales bacterium]